MIHKLIKTDDYLLVVDDSEIKVGDYFYSIREIVEQSVIDYPKNEHHGVIIAHLPLNGSPILEGVDLLPPYFRHQEDGLDEFELFLNREVEFNLCPKDIIERIKWYYQTYFKPKEKYKYTEEDVVHLLHKTARKYFQEGREYKGNMAIAGDPLHGVRRELMNMVQSLHQYPTEFECEMEYYYHSSPKYYHDAGFVKCDESQYNIIRKTIPECDTKIEPKTITTAQGVQWVGKYK
jgi:hypothetical protein